MIRLSIVIPTHNRVHHLRQNVLALTRQTAPPDAYEIVVVADGCTDGTSEMIAAMAPAVPCRLTVLGQQRAGAAAARNLGASSASGAILLFLDDDMEATPGLVAAHIAAHGSHPAVVLGRFWTPPGTTDGLLSGDARRWWAERAAAHSRPEHRFTFLDVCTGNLSMPTDLFNQVGGFDARIGAGMSGEDFEIGIRLVATGAHFKCADDAVSLHHDRPTRPRALNRAEQEGRGQTLLTQQYPVLFWQFAIRHLGRISGRQLLEPLSMLLWSWPGAARPFVAGVVFAAAVAERLGLLALARQLHSAAHRYHYFLGVRSIIGSRAAWERLQQEAPLEAADVREIEVDLAVDIDRLDGVLAVARPDAVRVSHRNTPILRIDPVFGAEPIRGVHVRRELLTRVPGLVLGLLLEEHGAGSAAG